MNRAAVRKFVTNGEAMTVKDNAGAELRPTEDASRWTAVLSTKDVDCEGDRVSGWKWDSEALPLMAAHAHGHLPVGTVRPYVEGDRLMGELTFPPLGTSVASDEARKLVEGGVVKAVSIGFAGLGKKNEHDGIDFSEVNVKEVSLVGVGCCASAKIEGRAKCACQRQAPGATTKAVVDSDPATDEPAAASGDLEPTTVLLTKNLRALVEKIHHAHVVKNGDEFQVVDDDGKVYGTHDTKKEADAQVAALYAAKAAFPGAAPAFGKVKCPKCEKDVVPGKDGKCPDCGAKMPAKKKEDEGSAKEDTLLIFARNFVKCWAGEVASYPMPYPMPAPPKEPKTFGEIMAAREAQATAYQIEDMQFAFFDSVRSIIDSGTAGAVALMQKSLDEYAAALGAFDAADPEKAAKLREKVGRTFSQANEAAMREVAEMLKASLASMHALLSAVQDKPQPEGEANYGNVLNPKAAPSEPVLLRLVAKQEPAAAVAPVVVRIRQDAPEELHDRMLKTGRLPG